MNVRLKCSRLTTLVERFTKKRYKVCFVTIVAGAAFAVVSLAMPECGARFGPGPEIWKTRLKCKLSFTPKLRQGSRVKTSFPMLIAANDF